MGHLNKAHGTKGEIFVWPLTDHPESTFAPGVILYLGDQAGDPPGSRAAQSFHQSAPAVPPRVSPPLEGVETREEAEALKDCYVLRPREEIEGLAEGEVFYHQLLGMKVRDRIRGGDGEIVEVYELRPADLLEVKGPSKTHFIPFLESIVKEVDAEAGTMVIDPPEGLLDL